MIKSFKNGMLINCLKRLSIYIRPHNNAKETVANSPPGLVYDNQYGLSDKGYFGITNSWYIPQIK